eukprot:SM000009S23523  [mRNA]  locus=s9:491209:492360:+ [translate_table: standard]
MDELAAMVESATEEIRRTLKQMNEGAGGADGLFTQASAFVRAVDWTEPWLLGLIACHIILILLVITTWRRINVQAAIFLFACASVYGAERMNRLLGRYWKKFATQQYFDRQGIFISTVLSGPMLIIATIILVNLLRNVVDLMVRWKRAQLRHRAALARKEE